MSRPLFVGSYLQFTWLSTNEKKEKFSSIDERVFFVVKNRSVEVLELVALFLLYFHDRIDFNGVALSRVTRMESRIFFIFGVRQFFILTASKRTFDK